MASLRPHPPSDQELKKRIEALLVQSRATRAITQALRLQCEQRELDWRNMTDWRFYLPDPVET